MLIKAAIGLQLVPNTLSMHKFQPKHIIWDTHGHFISYHGDLNMEPTLPSNTNYCDTWLPMHKRCKFNLCKYHGNKPFKHIHSKYIFLCSKQPFHVQKF